MTRTYSDFNTDLSRSQLSRLADKTTAPDAYKDSMILLGERLGEVVSSKISDSASTLYLACTVEDADYLAKGMLTPLERHFKSVSLACFWNERFSPFNVSDIQASPIIRKYTEPVNSTVNHLVIVKSIISGGCVVKTNLNDLIQTINPEKIFIVAPVIYSGAEERLAVEFEASVREKFQFIYLAEDDERSDEGEVIPGIGGMVYERLGFDGQEGKNKYVPELVRTRRRQLVSKV
ncbi:hypothetical protein [Leptolyngbya sp. BC1307]|uniref:hypothetical protein n=1 Tax=Leptolyngbya sp. BC1307 TaxID=2029589 RepID=UPI000EFBE77C|nr:hypothetical protein [Leptolyngbya sp. BC1307]